MEFSFLFVLDICCICHFPLQSSSETSSLWIFTTCASDIRRNSEVQSLNFFYNKVASSERISGAFPILNKRQESRNIWSQATAAPFTSFPIHYILIILSHDVIWHDLSSPAQTLRSWVRSPTRGPDVCVRLIHACVELCIGRDIALGWSPVQGGPLSGYRLKQVKRGAKAQQCAVEPITDTVKLV
jgi:hypothetical protein